MARHADRARGKWPAKMFALKAQAVWQDIMREARKQGVPSLAVATEESIALIERALIELYDVGGEDARREHGSIEGGLGR